MPRVQHRKGAGIGSNLDPRWATVINYAKEQRQINGEGFYLQRKQRHYA